MSAHSTTRFLVGLAAAASTALLAAPAAVAAGETGLPGMCTGRSDPSMTLNAHANGDPKLILNLETDAAGAPDGVLVLGRGSGRVYVDDLCRFWQHLPGQVPGGEGHEDGGHEGEDIDEGATTAHAVGIGWLTDGTKVLVRADVRENDEGRFFRARYREMGQHGGETAAVEEGHDDEMWTRVPVEGWAPLKQLNLR
jgi:hypothetical protein